MAAPSSEDIRLKSIACQDALLALIAGAKKQPQAGLIDVREIQNHHERFTQWAGNLGAFHKPESRLSLEYRLRNSPQIRDAILRLLADLCDSTRDALDIVSGKQENRTALPLIDLELDFGEFDLSSGSESSYASSSGKMAPAACSASEIDELTSAIKGSINSLFKTSIFIRNFAPKQRRQKAAEKTDSFVSQIDEMYIKDRYPLVEQRGRADLVTRLGLANALRRQYFLYCREHNEKLSKTESVKDRKDTKDQFIHEDSKQRTASTSGQTYTSIIAQTEATELPADNLAHSHISTFLDTEPAPSLISLATTIIKSPDDDIAFPPLPSDAQNNLVFLCPYCLRVVKMKPQDKEQQCRKHVLSDLEPYVCTFPGCGLDTFQSQHAWFDHEILIHRGTWRCSQCGEIAGTAEALENHIKRHHADQISPPQIPAVIEQSRRPIKFIQPAECPFCEDEWVAAAAPNSEVAGTGELVVTLDDFRRHLGHHLQRIALFSLPRLRQDRETSSSAVVGGTMDRSLSSVAALPLGDQIVESLVVSTFPPGSHHVYMPEGHLDQLVTRQSIIWEFTGASDVDFEGQDWAHVGEELIEYILMSAKKVFAISLICGVESSNLRKAMNTFKFTGFNDSNLPIQSTKSTEVPWSLLQWPVVTTQKFEQRQWMFLVPIFHTEFLRMELEPHEILPFALIKNERSQGSAEDLWEVSIHESHCEAPIRKFDGSLATTAIQALKPEKWDALGMLMKGSTDRLHHPHILEVQAIIDFKGKGAYFVSQWADGGSLVDMYDNNQHPLLTSRLVNDIFRQLTGLAEALEILLEYGTDDKQRVWYRHKGLDAESILRFENGSQVGILKMSQADVIDRRVRVIENDPGYWIPDIGFAESAIESTAEFSPDSETWSMGCIIFELLIWLLYGTKELEGFRSRAREFSNGGNRFFVVEKIGNKLQCRLSPYVQNCMDYIERDPACDGDTAIGEIVKILRSRLLVVSLQNTITPAQARSSARDLHYDLQNIMLRGETNSEYWYADRPRNDTLGPVSSNLVTNRHVFSVSRRQ